MSRFREGKSRLAAMCASNGWKDALDRALVDAKAGRAAINPLLALLPRPELRLRAAYGLGRAVARMAEADPEAARVFMRRMLWSLNEDSGNLGWGVPEAMGSILAESAPLAAEYARIFLSYGYQTGKADNFLDYVPLRRGLYWGIGRLARGNPSAARPALPPLAAALSDPGEPDRQMRGLAAFALEQLALHAPLPDSEEERAAWEAALAALERGGAEEQKAPEEQKAHEEKEASGEKETAELLDLYDDGQERRVTAGQAFQAAERAVRRRLAGAGPEL